MRQTQPVLVILLLNLVYVPSGAILCVVGVRQLVQRNYMYVYVAGSFVVIIAIMAIDHTRYVRASYVHNGNY